MRRWLIAGNWKMHLLREEALLLVRAILDGAAAVPADRDLLILPPYTLLTLLSHELSGTRVQLGAQDLHWESHGAYTSGISGPMLRDSGCRYVLVGHSERRDHFGDTGEILARKLRAALRAGLAPIYCVGEHLEDREAGQTEQVLACQFGEVLAGLDSEAMSAVSLAYEPVWAIGTGRTATPQIAEDAHRLLRELAAREFGDEIAGALRILYGGSVKSENAAALLAQSDIDGALVGGASLTAKSFLGIASAAGAPVRP